MRLKSLYFTSIVPLLTSTGALAQECPSGSTLLTVGEVTKCVPTASVVVIIDPVWLVAAGILLVLIFAVSLYTAIKVPRLTNQLQGGRQIG